MNQKMIVMWIFAGIGAAAFSLCSLWFSSLVQPYKGDVQVRFREEDKISSKTWKGWKEEIGQTRSSDIRSMAAWNLERGVLAEATTLERCQSVTLIEVSGDKSLIMSDKIINGNFGLQDEENGCVISKSVAWDLFGSLNILGMEVRCREKNWIIRGVTDSEFPVILVSAEGVQPQSYKNLVFRCFPGGNPGKTIKEMLFQYGKSGNEILIDGNFWWAVVQLIKMMPYWALVLSGFQICMRWNGKYQRILIGVIFLLLVVWGIKSSFYFSSDFIPGRWSDFLFWKEKMQQIKTSVFQWKQMWIQEVDGGFQRIFYGSFICSILSVLLIERARLYFIISDKMRKKFIGNNP